MQKHFYQLEEKTKMIDKDDKIKLMFFQGALIRYSGSYVHLAALPEENQIQ